MIAGEATLGFIVCEGAGALASQALLTKHGPWPTDASPHHDPTVQHHLSALMASHMLDSKAIFFFTLPVMR
jgi:hypothetical protein